MTSKTLVLAIFESESGAETAAEALRSSGTADRDAIGVLVLDANGGLKMDKVGARSIGKGAGVGAALALLGPIGVGVGVVGGAAVGALHHKGLQLTGSDRARISAELTHGKAAVGVLSRGVDVRPVSAALTDLGGTLETHDVSDEDALQATEEVD
jgi:Protein of unknown function (DUF1269)